MLSQAVGTGLKCALVEKDKIGGTCLTRGCIPSKVLVHPADLIREAEHAEKVGLKFKLASRPDWALIAKRMWSQIDESKEMEHGLERTKNVDVYRDVGWFTSPYEMEVATAPGQDRVSIRGAKIVIASGARTSIPPIAGLDATGYVSNESFFGEKFPKKPYKSLLIIGGGIIAAEFAHIFSAMDTAVAIVQHNTRLVPSEEPEVSAMLERNFQRFGIKVFTNKDILEAKKEKSKKYLVMQDRTTGEKEQVEGEEILLATGRKSNADLLKVENAGIETDNHGYIVTNEFLETNVPNIWCIGDANGKFQFRHKANLEAEICINNVLGDRDRKATMEYSATPWAIFTHPQIAHVGMTEREAIDKGLEIYVAHKHYSSVANGFALGYDEGDEDDGFCKLVVSKDRKIVGASVIGPNAAVLLQSVVYLMNAGIDCAIPTGDGKLQHVSSYACPDAGSVLPLYRSQVIHPSLAEVVGWATGALRPVNVTGLEYHHHHEHEEEKEEP